jgi:hypothetical protein
MSNCKICDFISAHKLELIKRFVGRMCPFALAFVRPMIVAQFKKALSLLHCIHQEIMHISCQPAGFQQSFCSQRPLAR